MVLSRYVGSVSLSNDMSTNGYRFAAAEGLHGAHGPGYALNRLALPPRLSACNRPLQFEPVGALACLFLVDLALANGGCTRDQLLRLS